MAERSLKDSRTFDLHPHPSLQQQQQQTPVDGGRRGQLSPTELYRTISQTALDHAHLVRCGLQPQQPWVVVIFIAGNYNVTLLCRHETFKGKNRPVDSMSRYEAYQLGNAPVRRLNMFIENIGLL